MLRAEELTKAFHAPRSGVVDIVRGTIAEVAMRGAGGVRMGTERGSLVMERTGLGDNTTRDFGEVLS